MRSFTCLLLIICFSCSFGARAQSKVISGKVTGESTTLVAATVSLLSGKDSAWLRSQITGDNGSYSFGDVAPGRYIVTATYIGHSQGSRAVEVAQDNVSCDIDLRKDGPALAEVAITGRKPFIEMTMGKTIVNIEGTTTTAGLNALDLMRRLPGVTVDQNGTIAMMGKEGVLVFIDDRPTYLSGDDLADYLRTMTADEISQMEIISQPGAKYDASGNTGVINIKLRKNRLQGWNGNVSLFYGQGVFYSRHEDFNLSYRKNKLSLAINASDMEAKGFADWHEQLYYIDPNTGAVTATSAVHSDPVERFSTEALRLAADYSLTDKATIGVNVRGSYHPNNMPTDLRAVDSDLLNKTVSFREEKMKDFSIKRDITSNAYCIYKFNKSNTLDVNFDYLTFSKLFNQDFARTVLDAGNNPVSDPYILSSHQPQQIKVYSIKADYSGTLGNDVKLEAGLKSSFAKNDATAMFSQWTPGGWVNDTGISNHFVYTENINAAYVTASKPLGSKWDARAGLRVEQTQADGTQYVNYSHFSRNYASLFPTVYITYKMDSANQFEVNYGRRIDRPRYTQLNPFVYYSFQNTYRVGNPMLQPEFTDVVELKHSYKNTILTKITYSGTSHVVTDLLEVHDTSRLVYNIERNLASNNYIAGSVTFHKDVFKWFSLNATGTVFSAEYSGPVNGVGKTVKWSGCSLNASGQLNFVRDWKAEFYANWFSAGRAGINESFDGHVYMELGASKKINEKLIVRFSANDPFGLDQLHVHNDAGNFKENTVYRYASRLFSASLTYSFGKKTNEDRQPKDIEEARRL